MLSWMSKREEYRYTVDFIKEEFGGAPNIEDVITKLDAHIKSLEGSEELEDRLRRSNAAHQRGKLREAVPVWFTEIHTNFAPAYQQFAERIVQPGDVIITFNYDDSLERELKRVGKWDVSQGYGFQIGTLIQPSPVLVLKLHGSMNWLVSIFGGITSGAFAASDNSSLGRYPCIATDYLKYLGYIDMAGTFPGGGGFPSLILPGRTKEFYYHTSFGPEHEEFFSSLWSQAPGAGQKGIVKISAVSWGNFLEDESKTLEDPALFMPERAIRADDLLISRANTIDLVGACVLVRDVKRTLMLSDKVLRLQATDKWKRWLLICLRSPLGRFQIENLATGNQLSMRNITQDSLRRIVIPLPSPRERDEAAHRVEQLLGLADAIEERIVVATSGCNNLTQSILAKAFRGELVPTEGELARREGRDYEPASVLLERIKSERASVDAGKKQRSKRAASRGWKRSTVLA